MTFHDPSKSAIFSKRYIRKSLEESIAKCSAKGGQPVHCWLHDYSPKA